VGKELTGGTAEFALAAAVEHLAGIFFECIAFGEVLDAVEQGGEAFARLGPGRHGQQDVVAAACAEGLYPVGKGLA